MMVAIRLDAELRWRRDSAGSWSFSRSSTAGRLDMNSLWELHRSRNESGVRRGVVSKRRATMCLMGQHKQEQLQVCLGS